MDISIQLESSFPKQRDVVEAHKEYIVELLAPNFQQQFAFWGRSMKFGVEILLTMLYLNIDRSKTF